MLSDGFELVSPGTVGLSFNGPPKAVRYTVDLHKNLVQMPLPIRVCPQFLNPFSPDPCGEYRAEPVPAETHGFVADVDPALVQKVFDIPKRKRNRIYNITARRISGLVLNT